MAPAQFNECLRSMQRTFEAGISKGCVRGADEIAGNLSFLSVLNGGSELWKGEQGANRLAQINSSIAQATKLESTSDVLVYRAAQNVLKGYTEDDWTKLLDVDKDGIRDIIKGSGSSEHLNPLLLIERGLTPELFNESMKMFDEAEMGDYGSIIARMNKTFGLDNTQSTQLYRNWIQHKDTPGYFDSKEFAQELEKYREKPPENNSTELTMLEEVGDIKKYTYEIGQWHLDQKMPLIAEELKNAWEEAYGKGGTTDTEPGKHLNPYQPPEPPDPPNPPPDPPNPPPDPPNKPPFPLPTVPETLEDLKKVVTAPPTPGAPTGDIIRTAQNRAIEAQVLEGKRRAEIEKMLIKEGTFWHKKDVAFFTGNGLPLIKNEDEMAVDNFLGLYDKTANDSTGRNFLNMAVSQMEAFTPDQRTQADDKNSLNDVLLRNELTAQKLYEAVIELARQMNVEIVFNDINGH
jgi:hypothetical protein